jgi:hypothetical protein
MTTVLNVTDGVVEAERPATVAQRLEVLQDRLEARAPAEPLEGLGLGGVDRDGDAAPRPGPGQASIRSTSPGVRSIAFVMKLTLQPAATTSEKASKNRLWTRLSP